MAEASGIELRIVCSGAELGDLEPLWSALQEHHAAIEPELAVGTPARAVAESWRMRRRKYERWIEETDSYYVLAELEGAGVGYAFVTVGPGYASWATGERLAELETLSVLPGERGAGIGEALIEAAWDRLETLGVEDLQITTAITNVDSHRFYERHGFRQAFVVYYGRRS